MQVKRIVSTLALSFFLVACGTTVGTMHSPAQLYVPSSLVVLGDSIAAGQYLPDSTTAYPRLLAAELHATLTVYAMPGLTAVQVSRFYARELSPTYAVIELGTNDYKDGVPLARFAAAYQSTVGNLSPGTRLVCLSVWDPDNVADAAWSSPLGIPSPVNRLGASPAAYNAIIKHSCRGTYLSVQSLYEMAAYHGNGAPGPLYHPNVAGDAAIAQLVYSVL